MAHTAFETAIGGSSETGVTPKRVVPSVLAGGDTKAPRRRWAILWAVLIGLVLVPLSFAARIDTQVVLSDGFGPDKVYFYTALAFVGGFHLLLAGLGVVAMAHRFRNMLLNLMVLEMLIGYGLASVMFATIGA